jgi:hypothetical protein
MSPLVIIPGLAALFSWTVVITALTFMRDLIESEDLWAGFSLVLILALISTWLTIDLSGVRI